MTGGIPPGMSWNPATQAWSPHPSTQGPMDPVAMANAALAAAGMGAGPAIPPGSTAMPGMVPAEVKRGRGRPRKNPAPGAPPDALTCASDAYEQIAEACDFLANLYRQP